MSERKQKETITKEETDDNNNAVMAKANLHGEEIERKGLEYISVGTKSLFSSIC